MSSREPTAPAPIVLAERPRPGTPRPYEFPRFERIQLSNGLTVITVDLPGRPLVSASLLLRNGAADEPHGVGGATVLAARALSEGTERYDAVALVEATERLGAAIHAEAGWDATTISVEVPGTRLTPALELLFEVAARPMFPASEVDRLRDERLNDILQAHAEPRRRVDEALIETIYAEDSPYHRPSGGTRETVERLDRDVLRAAYARGVDPARATLVVAGELAGLDVTAIAERIFGAWAPGPGVGGGGSIVARSSLDRPRVRVIHRPGAVQTEVRVGHVGLPRRIPDFHALSVMSAILGGLFNSRLNMKLREEKGYTYGAGAGFDLRRAAGPFSARAAVHTAATVPAILDTLGELRRMRDERVSDAELTAARDFLVGVFPLRFETPGPIVGALAGIVIHDLPDDELTRYRPAIEAVRVADVLAVSQAHLDLEHAAIVLVGDADAFLRDLEAAGLGDLEVEREPAVPAEAPIHEGRPGPVDGGEGADDEESVETGDAESVAGGQED